MHTSPFSKDRMQEGLLRRGEDQKLRICMGATGIFGGAYIICSPRVPGHALRKSEVCMTRHTRGTDYVSTTKNSLCPHTYTKFLVSSHQKQAFEEITDIPMCGLLVSGEKYHVDRPMGVPYHTCICRFGWEFCFQM
jgi:hypothetical protein